MRYRLAEIWDEWERKNQQTLSYRQLARQANVSLRSVQKVMEGKMWKCRHCKSSVPFLAFHSRK